MRTQPIEIDSIEWFPYEIRMAALHLIEAGDKDDIEQRLTEVMAHPRLREIVKFLALFGFGAVRQHFNNVSPSVHGYIGRERQLAEDLSGLPTYIPEIAIDTRTIRAHGDTPRWYKSAARYLTKLKTTATQRRIQ